MLCNKKTKLNLAILLMVAAVLGVTATSWATHKEGHNPGGGGGGKPGGDGQDPSRYTQVYLGTLGGLHSGANGINDAGQVVGDTTTNAGDYHAFLLTPEDCDLDGKLDWFCDDGQGGNALMIDLGTFPGYIYSGASGINDSGQVVGGSYGDVDGTGRWHAFLWDSTNGMIDLGTLGGEDGLNWANAINGAGQVVGQAATDVLFRHAFLWEDLNGNGWSDTGEMIDLGTLGGPQSEALSINDSGQVVGSADTSATDKDGRFIERAFLITPEDDELEGKWVWFRDDGQGGNALMTDLGTLGGLRSWGAAMNDSGQIAGTGQINNNNHAFLITPEYDEAENPVVWFRDSDGDGTNDLMTDLGILKGTNGSASADLNNAGQVVGQCFKASGGRPGTGRSVRKPFLWENGQMKDLNELTDSDIDLGGWIRGINNTGQIVSYSGYILLPIP